MRTTFIFFACAMLFACSQGDDQISEDLRCQVGTYRLSTGALIDIGLSSPGYLRWRTLDGRVGRISLNEDSQTWSGTLGWTERAHPAQVTLGDCDNEKIEITGIEGLDGEGEKVAVEVTDTRFKGADVELAGRLVMPIGETPVPIVIMVHGSEDSSALDYYHQQRTLPAQGIGVFVYDKRGTGSSSGEYTQDFHLLAQDAAMAHATAIRLAANRAAASGYFGGSQGGWVAPLAATLSDVDFVIASYGMAEGPLAENRDEIQLSLRKAGYDQEVLAKGKEITDITGRLLVSNFKDGADDLARVRSAYSSEPWFQLLEGGVTWEMISRPLWQFRIGYVFMDVGTSWDYQPLPVLREVEADMLWVLAGADSSAPPQRTREILTQLQNEGLPIDVAYFPNTEHGIIRFETTEDGEQLSLGYAPGYFPLLTDWISTRQLGHVYEGAELAPRAASTKVD